MKPDMPQRENNSQGKKHKPFCWRKGIPAPPDKTAAAAAAQKKLLLISLGQTGSSLQGRGDPASQKKLLQK